MRSVCERRRGFSPAARRPGRREAAVAASQDAAVREAPATRLPVWSDLAHDPAFALCNRGQLHAACGAQPAHLMPAMGGLGLMAIVTLSGGSSTVQVTPSPTKPGSHVQLRPPSVLAQVASALQPPLLVAHLSTSALGHKVRRRVSHMALRPEMPHQCKLQRALIPGSAVDEPRARQQAS